MKKLLLLPLLILSFFTNAQEYWMEDGSVTTCTGVFMDSGGSGTYSANENFTYTICPDRSSDPRNAIRLDFTFLSIQPNFDFIYVYDGDTTTAPLIATIEGGSGVLPTVAASDIVANPSGCLTFVFISNEFGQGGGWAADISCQIPCQTIDIDVTTIPEMDSTGNVTILEGETVTFNGSATFSQDGSGATYTWDFGDGTTETNTTVTSHTYTDAGTYTVTLTVTDNSGNPDCTETYTFLVIVEYDNNVPCPSVEGIDFVDNSSDIDVTCAYPLDQNGCMRLRANYAVIKETTDYIVTSIPFEPPFPFQSDGELDEIDRDDVWSSVVDFPVAETINGVTVPGYRFCYFGQEEESLVVGANGRISFDLSHANNTDIWYNEDPLPTNNSDMMNTIFGAYHDMNIDDNEATADSQFSYGFTGSFPCRMFVVNYNELPLFGSQCEGMTKTTQQIVLWEGSNYIDVYIKDKANCTGWYPSLIGLQGRTFDQATPVPGRNNSYWSAQNEAWRFIPDGPEMDVDIVWKDAAGNVVGNEQDIDVCPTEDTFYTVTVTYQICGQDPITVEDQINIAFDYTIPEVADIPIQLCDTGGDGENAWNLNEITSTAIPVDQDWVIEGYYQSRRSADEAVDGTEIADPASFVSGSTTVYVRVEDQSSECFYVFEIDIELLDELTAEPIEETFCIPIDSNEYTVNLNDYLEHFQQGQFFDLTFYLDETEAQNGADTFLTGEEITAFTTTETVVIYVRFESQDECFGTSQITLNINDVPVDYTFDDAVIFCDNFTVGTENVDLTGYEDDMADGANGLNFFYYLNYNDALTTDASLAIATPEEFELTTDITEIYILIQSEDGCYKIITMPVELATGFDLNAVDYPLCDILNDGSETFNLPSVSDQIITNPQDYNFTYYLTEENAINQQDPITTDTSAYDSGETTIWVVVDNGSNCYNVTSINLILNETPIINVAELNICPNDANEYIFNLTLADPTILNGQTDITLSYYINATDAESGDNNLAITDPTSYTSTTDGEIIYVRLDNANDDCYSITELTLNHDLLPTATEAPDIQVCDADDSGSENVNITQNESTITGGATDVVVSYHNTQEGAENNDDFVTDESNFDATEGTTTIYVRVENAAGCFAITTFDVIVQNGLNLGVGNIEECDIDSDNTENWDLTSDNESIITNSTNYTFQYFPTQADLEGSVGEITNFDDYPSGETTIYVLVSTTDGCSAQTTLVLQFEDSPAQNPQTLDECADADGNYIFDFSEATTALLGGQTLDLYFYTTESDAQNNNIANAITNTTSYTSATDGEVIYVGLVTETGCFSYTTLTLNHNDQPTINTPPNLQRCDLDGNGSESIDLTEFENTTTGGASNVTVTYHNSQDGADNESDVINNQTNFLAQEGTTTIYVRVENTAGCFATTSFDITISDGLPLTNTSITLCDIGEDGTENFDITSMNDVISNGVTTYTYEYYTSYADETTNTPVTGDFTQFASTGQTIYILVTSAADCSSLAELELIVKDLPAVNTDLEWPVCDPEFDGVYSFTLTDLNDLVVNSTAGYSFEYYTSLTDAENQTNDYTQADANNVTSVPLDIYVRVAETGNDSNCVNYAVVTLDEGEQTQVNTEIAALEDCEDGTSGSATFDLYTMVDAVTDETGDLTISFHNSLANAQNDSSPLNPDSAVLSQGTVYVRVTADGKCPSITEFDVNINANPVAEIFAPTMAYCSSDSISISANNFNPDYTYSWTNEAGTVLGTEETLQLMGEDGDQSITLTVTDEDTTCFGETTLDFESVNIPVITSLNTTNNSIAVSASGDGPFEYSLDGTTWVQNSTFDELLPGMYTVYIRSVNGECEGISMSTLVLDVANIITPNGDGLNDYFYVPFMDAFKDDAGNVQASNFYIYNRYGKLLFEDASSNEKTEFIWNGTSNGRTLPSGDYWYLLQLADGRKVTGHITVKNK